MTQRNNPTPNVKLATTMKRQGVTGADLARQTGLAVTTVSDILNGKRTAQRVTSYLLAQALHCSPQDIFPEEGSGGAV